MIFIVAPSYGHWLCVFTSLCVKPTAHKELLTHEYALAF